KRNLRGVALRRIRPSLNGRGSASHRACAGKRRQMTSKKTGYILGAVAGAGVMAAAVAGAGMRLPSAHAEMGGGLIKASTAPIFAPPPGAPMSFADIFQRVSPAVVSINVTSRAEPDALRQIPGFGIIPRLPPGAQGG